MNSTPAPAPTRARRARRTLAAGALALLAGASMVACTTRGTNLESTAASTTTVATQEPTTTVAEPTPGGGNQGGGNQSGGGNQGGGNQGGGQTTTTVAPAPAPTITSFETPENIDCHNGNFQEFTASWTTTNAVDVTISIDGPGAYASYPANGSTSLPFNCSSSHTFLLTANGHGGQVATRTVTLDPRNVQMPDQGDDDEQ
jgi:hypothetical protein